MARLTAITLIALFVDFLPRSIFLDRMKTMKTNATSTASLAVIATSLPRCCRLPPRPRPPTKRLAIATEVDNRERGGAMSPSRAKWR